MVWSDALFGICFIAAGVVIICLALWLISLTDGDDDCYKDEFPQGGSTC